MTVLTLKGYSTDTEPDSPSPRKLDVVRGIADFIVLLREAVRNGRLATQDQLRFATPSHRGQHAYINVVDYLTCALVELGWKWEDVKGQRQFIPPSDFGIGSMRIVYLTGWKTENQTFRINKRNDESQVTWLVDNQGRPGAIVQGKLMDVPATSGTPERLLHLFLFSKIYWCNNGEELYPVLRTYLVYPSRFSEPGREIECDDEIVVDDISLRDIAPAAIADSMANAIEPTIEDIEEM